MTEIPQWWATFLLDDPVDLVDEAELNELEIFFLTRKASTFF